MDGDGVLTFENGHVYIGQFKADKIEGKGTETLDNGETYVGNFANDFMHGAGKVINKKGEVIKAGIWEDGEFKEEKNIGGAKRSKRKKAKNKRF
ncbi:hypothetical protein AGMMS49949_07770 [Alphaproteobacteria bacterium]|nr:hypothetical protein AGMMS49949_07770 [Alphaproteobacteria bacterium]GHS99000.1 hypothetical protein AGMMS50296_6940 [Alphaproteobacteria bacterium]